MRFFNGEGRAAPGFARNEEVTKQEPSRDDELAHASRIVGPKARRQGAQEGALIDDRPRGIAGKSKEISFLYMAAQILELLSRTGHGSGAVIDGGDRMPRERKRSHFVGAATAGDQYALRRGPSRKPVKEIGRRGPAIPGDYTLTVATFPEFRMSWIAVRGLRSLR